MVMLEQVRKKLRDLVQFIEKRSRNVLYTDFEDEMGEATSFDLLGITPPQDMERFKAKARAFLRDHQDHIAIHRLRMNKPLTPNDLEALESMLAENGIGDAETIARAKEESQGLGLFVRSLIGLDRGAAKEAFADFLEGKIAHRESDRVRRPDHQSPHRARRHGCGTAVRVTVHRHRSTWPR